MKKTQFLTFLGLLLINLVSSQTLQFLSDKTNLPLPKVSVFNNEGNIVAYSDIDGKIEKSTLKQEEEKFKIIYDNFPMGEFSYDELNKSEIKLKERVKDIETVVIKNNKPAKYVFVKGNFNTYITTNNKLTYYADGIITYIFDNKTKKLKSINIEQYRVFKLEGKVVDRKRTETLSFVMNIPNIKNAGNISEYKKKGKTEVKELKGNQKDQVQIKAEALQEKEFAFFGYRFFDSKETVTITYDKDSKKTLRDLFEYNSVIYIKIKHKSEPNYNQIIGYQNFYPTELNFNDEKEIESVKFSTQNSNYKTKFWEEPDFPNMQTIFSSYFKDDLKEKENKK